jgi:hypothetical protein
MTQSYGDVQVTDLGDFVALAEICRAPNNFFDLDLIRSLADAFDALDQDASCRVVVLRPAKTGKRAARAFRPRAIPSTRKQCVYSAIASRSSPQSRARQWAAALAWP